jgi:two-component system, OmpR family, sensor histidine kinase ArlS
MKSKMVEWVRQLLIKVVLPIRNKKDRFLSNFRFSMVFRISLHYLKIFLINGVIFSAIIFFIIWGMEQQYFGEVGRDLFRKIGIDIMWIKERKPIIMGTFFIYFCVSFGMTKYGEKGISKLLEPIGEMSNTANRLTVNNLHSERLNVEGTKNELKDLASTINKSLDRIDLSYESQKQFVSDASHELRTPIAVIQGYVNLLDRWGKKDELIMEESIEAIKNEAKSMQELVEKLLFLSRHDKKTLKLAKSRFNMCEVVEDMVKETKFLAEHRNIKAKVLENVMVYGDKQALKQAIRVFIDNAVKYTKDGDSITISCKNVKGDCTIEVQDTGIGMTKKDAMNIFERFYRSDQVRNEKISGHGLGLSIAKLIILKHTGTIKVRSQFTKGSTFLITIPKRRV